MTRKEEEKMKQKKNPVKFLRLDEMKTKTKEEEVNDVDEVTGVLYVVAA